METEKDLLSRIDGVIHEVVGGVVRMHAEVGQAIAGTAKASTFGHADDAIEKVREAELGVVTSLGEGVKRASTVVTDTLRRVATQLRG